MAYSGESIQVDELLFNAKHNLIDQSMSSRSAETPTNGDGFGLGWYGRHAKPGLFRSIRPAWNDFNLHDLAANIDSHMFMAHVRATSLATVQETNCHPFRYGNWLFVHNGEVFEIEKFQRELLLAVDPKYFRNIMGSTDSELMFHLALTFGLEDDVPGALMRMAGFIERAGKEKGVAESLWMTLGVTDGKTLYGVRYASDNAAPTLYHSVDPAHILEINPLLKGRIGETARSLASEPIGVFPQIWKEVPQATLLTVRDGEIASRAFVPK